MFNYLWHGLQHARLPCPSLSPRVCSNSCPLSRWCHPTISSSGALFSSCSRSSPKSRSFPMSWLLASGDQSIRASASVLPVKTQGWFPLELTDLISLLSKGLLRIFSSTTVWKHQLFSAQSSLCQPSHLHMTTGKAIGLSIQTFVGKVMSLLFNILSRFVIAFYQRASILWFHGWSYHPQWFWTPRK